MRRSTKITLTLVSAVSLTACGNNSDVRNHYRSREDCVADYSEAQCQPATGAHYYGGGWGGGYGGGGGYYGPAYARSEDQGDAGRGRHGLADAQEPVTRGGFGHLGSRYGGGS